MNASQKQMLGPGYLRRGGAAKYLNISPRTLTDWQRRRLIPFAKISHRVCLFKKEDLDRAVGRLTTHAVGD